ncbi:MULTISPECIES: phycobilisome linker polypeptide [unclassified Coleofasciculus]|uniref:phycobilisome linker polypeptide n=1 Tax=Cyanophyceae TaxID=3028117 RepID=UPI001F5549F7|nr:MULTISPECIES: phycobilisome linker polypeptide [unclassified Coleofasciculus]
MTPTIKFHVITPSTVFNPITGAISTMFGQTALGSGTLGDAANRVFRYEVEGLRQTYESDKLSYPIRRSGSFYITVPYSRMNEEMQRINRMGGRIVNIQPLTLDGDSEAKSQATTAHQNHDAEGKR